MAEVNTSIYQNQPNPLGNLTNVLGIANAAQQNQLLQTANQQRQLELQQGYATGLYNTIAPLINSPGITQSQVRAAAANYARQVGIPPQAHANFDAMIAGPDWKTNLNNLAIRAVGPAGITARTPAINEQGAISSIPETSVIGKPLPTGLGPAAVAAKTAAGGAAGTLLGGMATEQADYRRLVTPLEQAIPALERLGPTKAGPTSDEINTMKSLAITWGIAPQRFTGDVKDYDEAKKYLIDNARQMGNTSTNDQLAASFSANPNVEHMSQAASVDVAKTLLALRRMKYMQLQAFYSSGAPQEDFPKFVSQWNARHDPRAFGFDQYNKEKRKQILKSVKDPQQFIQDVNDAKNAGVLTPRAD